MPVTREIVLRYRIEGLATAGDFELVERERPEAPGAGELLVRPLYLSLDPYMGQAIRGRHMGDVHPGAGDRLPGMCVAEVLASGDERFNAGDHVVGEAGWTEIGIMQADRARRVDASLGTAIHLGVLGSPGLTAWAGVTQLAKVGKGDVFTVDAAAGPVGGTAGQIAHILGAKTVGIAGGAEKCALVRDVYGFDDCVDYRDGDWVSTLKTATDGGQTVHFENVGLPVLEPVMTVLRNYGRVVLCGLVGHGAGNERPAIPIGTIMVKRATMLGLIVYDFLPRIGEWVDFARPHIESGRLVQHSDISEGLESAPAQFEKLLNGRNVGKTMVKLADI